VRVTLLGHASLLIETSDLVILTDPTFGDSAVDGIAQFCPRRRYDPSKLPDIDILYISHIHTDHFDVETLALLPERVNTVLAPNDHNILDAVRALGFENVMPIRDNQQIELGATTLRITQSRFDVPEHGLLVTDESGRVWNQVDTLSDPAWLPNLLSDGIPIDVHFANFAPLSWYHVLVNGPSSFPYEVYAEQFDVVRYAKAKLVIPASAGLSFRGEWSYMNRYWFPIRHADFEQDIRRVMAAETAFLHPGDVVELERGKPPRVHKQAAPHLVETTDPSTDEIAFDPTAQIASLVETNPDNIEVAELHAAVTEVLDAVRAALASGAKRHWIDRLQPWEVRMAITVHFPTHTAHWSIDFREPQPALVSGRIEHANYVFEATASGLHGVQRALHWDRFFYFGYRAFHTVYRVRPEGIFYPNMPAQGRIGVGAIPLPHELFFSLWGPTPKAWITRRVERALARPGS
jgi:UDP-MurNAc hydroxylase